jgi:hypothetical protein
MRVWPTGSDECRGESVDVPLFVADIASRIGVKAGLGAPFGVPSNIGRKLGTELACCKRGGGESYTTELSGRAAIFVDACE